MNLIKEQWTKEDGKEFNLYLKSIEEIDKKEWTRKIINTNMECLAIKSPVIKEIVKQIFKGNYLSFLDLNLWNYYENTAINGLLISKIEDFNIMKKYLDIYSSKVDNWASCDVLAFNIKNNKSAYYDLVLEYIKDSKPFRRRIGIVILFNFVKYPEYLSNIFSILDSFTLEEEYYVNMINAWLICECFIKHRNETNNYLGNNKLNKFTINKAISKCRDSFRVTKEDKEMLLKYKKESVNKFV